MDLKPVIVLTLIQRIYTVCCKVYIKEPRLKAICSIDRSSFKRCLRGGKRRKPHLP
jgi:hypothetical protein